MAAVFSRLVFYHYNKVNTESLNNLHMGQWLFNLLRQLGLKLKVPVPVMVRWKMFNASERIRQTMLSLTSFATVNQVEIIDNIDREYFVYADNSHFNFVLINVLTNSIKYSPNCNKLLVSVIATLNYVEISIEAYQDAEQIKKKGVDQDLPDCDNTIQDDLVTDSEVLVACKRYVAANKGIMNIIEYGQRKSFIITFLNAE